MSNSRTDAPNICSHIYAMYLNFTPLSTKLWWPYRVIVTRPLLTFMVYALGNALFLLCYWVIYGIIRLVSPLGLLFLIIIFIVYGLCRLIAILVYPGQLDVVIREGEQAYARLQSQKLQLMLESIQQLMKANQNFETNRSHSLKYKEVSLSFRYLYSECSVLLMALEVIEKQGLINAHGVVLARALCDLKHIVENDIPLITSLHYRSGTENGITSSSMGCNSNSSVITDKENSLSGSLETIGLQIRDCIPLLGGSSENTPKDLKWAIQQLSLRKNNQSQFIATLDLMRADLSRGEQVWISGYNGQCIDAMFLSAASENKIERSIILLCNPNGGLYEFHHIQTDWVRFYIERGCDVLVYNYRGYGRNKGHPQPALNNADALAIIAHIKALQTYSKIGVHGESIGGLVATYVASQCPDIAVLVADRTFASIPALSQRLIAKWTAPIIRTLTRWDTNVVSNYLSASCPKIVCSDPDDEIILDSASLKSGVALKIELGDTSFDLPEPLLTSSQSESRAFIQQCGPGLPVKCSSTHHHRWRNAIPITGACLTEDLLRRLSFSIISIAHRAFEYSRQNTSASRVNGDPQTCITLKEPKALSEEIDTDEESYLIVELDTQMYELGFPQDVLGYVWMQLASLDGYCGQTLLQAAERGGHDRIRAWTASLLLWGGKLASTQRSVTTCQPFERNQLLIQPLLLHSVYDNMQTVIREYQDKPLQDPDIAFLYMMVEFLWNTIQERWKQHDRTALRSTALDDSASKSGKEESATVSDVGILLPLHCGHNRNFSDHEKNQLTAVLKEIAFIE
uniref:Uncharacterized protein AlNc14C141G7244 n=1 Tax=Albugo laibachii Nc14 TaxID=890382 RepID=F0WL56_9STRA|nr:conserved hypothetical protein [Albugo laibachii Nc14]|eukprot:CCA22017.1 conserved hypothetical protein [Albugo laibachii Nc14]